MAGGPGCGLPAADRRYPGCCRRKRPCRLVEALAGSLFRPRPNAQPFRPLLLLRRLRAAPRGGPVARGTSPSRQRSQKVPNPPPSEAALLASSPKCATSSSSRSEEHTSELQSRLHLVCRLLLEKKKKRIGRTRREPEPEERRRKTTGTLGVLSVSDNGLCAGMPSQPLFPSARSEHALAVRLYTH